uniref:Macaca fascicularis brain cDNA clone: QmoA-12506, similar to human transcriptional adaptor 3 (NGG1 homolog, yeast)-like(TADA3L), transcript variant 2, mRNA, RefSeq: NM_133480.1 n=1 Tax=Macaca fascicularis TaxID=9541 RepID=I7GPC8_MACFA|nr:unnamed protein product [Macaca fascicularis]
MHFLSLQHFCPLSSGCFSSLMSSELFLSVVYLVISVSYGILKVTLSELEAYIYFLLMKWRIKVNNSVQMAEKLT